MQKSERGEIKMQMILKGNMRGKVNRGLGIRPNSAEQNQPSRSQTLPNKIRTVGLPCFARPVSG